MTKTMNLGAAVVTIAALTLAVFAVLPASALACGGYCGGHNETNTNNSVSINVANSGAIVSVTGAVSNTGGNVADGSYGGDGDKGGSGGDGGVADADPDGHCDCDPGAGNANAGDGGNGGYGGNGGNGGPGGLVDTGDAEANAGSLNTLNSTEIEVQAADCGCEHRTHGWSRGETNTDNSVDVNVANSGDIVSVTATGANSGLNAAGGSYGGDGDKGGRGGEGGDAYASGGFWDWDDHFHGSEANGGDGGNGGGGGEGGEGGVGGTVRTGRAESNSGSINVMNSTIVRVTR